MDMISKHRAIDGIRDFQAQITCSFSEMWLNGMNEGFDHAVAVIELMETVEAEPVRHGKWIPCSERLPTKAGHYLCSFKKPNRIDNIFVDLAYWTGGRWYGYLANEINAWMPLPDRYEEEEE